MENTEKITEMENTEKITEKVLSKVWERKFDGYGYGGVDNFLTPTELTVTITLREYRELVGDKAVSEKKISEIRSEKYALEKEVNELKETVAKLREKITVMVTGEASQTEEEE